MEARSAGRPYTIVKRVIAPPLRRAYDLHVEDGDRLPDGAAILAANHRSFMDSVFLALVVDRPVSFLAKAEYFDRRRTAWLFRGLGQIPIRRGSPAGARRALESAHAVLDSGGVVGVYPEGTRSRDGRLHRGHLGPARLAAASGAPIVPIGLIGTDGVQPPGARLPRLRGTVTVRFGVPFRIGATDGRDLRRATDHLMAEVADLCDQPYVNRFAEMVTA